MIHLGELWHALNHHIFSVCDKSLLWQWHLDDKVGLWPAMFSTYKAIHTCFRFNIKTVLPCMRMLVIKIIMSCWSLVLTQIITYDLCVCLCVCPMKHTMVIHMLSYFVPQDQCMRFKYHDSKDRSINCIYLVRKQFTVVDRCGVMRGDMYSLEEKETP